MKTIFKVLSIVIFIFATTAKMYSQSADITEGCVPLDVSFEAPDGQASYYWDFKNGASSEDQNSNSIFIDPGTYEVSLHETQGGPVISTITIEVYAKPVLELVTEGSTGCTPFNFTLQDSSIINANIPVTNYTWDFGDGNGTTTTTGAVNHNYTVGIWNVAFSITSDFPTCNVTKTFDDFIEVVSPPSASFTTSPTKLTACDPPLDVDFTNTSTGANGFDLNYVWITGLGDTLTTENIPTQTYTKDSTYSIKLTTSYDFGCERTSTATVSIGKPTAELTILDDTICVGDMASLTATPTSGQYIWTIDDGTAFPTSTINTFNHSFSLPTDGGLHTIELIFSPDGDCQDTVSVNVFVDDFKVEAISTPDYSCDNPTIIDYEASSNKTDAEYNWNFTGGETSTLQNPDISYIIASDTDYYGINIMEIKTTTLTAISAEAECRFDTTLNDTIWKPNADFMPTITKGCAPLSVGFDGDKSNPLGEILITDGTITNYRWIFGDGNIEDGGEETNHIYTEVGRFDARLLITNSRGCTDTSYAIEIQVGDSTTITPEFTLSSNDICWEEAVTFTNTTVTDSLYDFKFFVGSVAFEDQGFDDCEFNTVDHTFNQVRGLQDVGMEVNYNGCFYTEIVENAITIKGTEAKYSFASTCETPLTYDFEASSTEGNPTSTTWAFGDTLISLTSFTFDFDSSSTVDVTLTTDNGDGCTPSVEEFTITPNVVTANIDLPDTNICVNTTTDFIGDSTTNANNCCLQSYTWIFPDSERSNRRPYTTQESSSSFSFNDVERGVQTVQLVAKDIHGCTDTVEALIKVYGIDVNYLVNDDTLCLPSDIIFTDSTKADTTIISWTLDYGDGSTPYEDNVTFDNITHTYTGLPANGAETTTLTIVDTLNCEESINIDLTLYKPSTSISFSKSNLCDNDSITVSATDFTSQGSNLSYSWDYGNGETGTERETTQTYSAESVTYTVSVDIIEDSTLCPGERVTRTLNVQEYPEAGFSTTVDSDIGTTDTTYCADKIITFTDTSSSTSAITSRAWNNGETADVFTDTDITYTYRNSGEYEASLIVGTSFGCRDTVSRVFQIRKIFGNFDISTLDPICQGDSITFSLKDTADVLNYTWNFGDGTDANDTPVVSHAYTYFNGETGIFPVILTLENGDCDLAIEKEVKIIDVVADFTINNGIDTARCLQLGATELFDNSKNADVYFWDFDNGQTSTLAGDKTIDYATDGTYDVKLIVSSNTVGCTDTLIKEVTLFPTPAITALNDTACVEQQLQLFVTNPIDSALYTWTPSTGLDFDTVINPLVDVDEITTYTVNVVDSNSCVNSDQATAFVIDELNLEDYDTTIVIGDQAILPVYGSAIRNFEWTPDTALSCLDCDYPIASPLETIEYDLHVTDDLDCFDYHVPFIVTVRPETFVRMPTTFSPNGDGINDIVFVRGWGIKELLSFEVYNRWGELLYESSDIEEGWNGIYKDKVQNSDAYAYKVVVNTWRNEEMHLEGYINLIH